MVTIKLRLRTTGCKRYEGRLFYHLSKPGSSASVQSSICIPTDLWRDIPTTMRICRGVSSTLPVLPLPASLSHLIAADVSHLAELAAQNPLLPSGDITDRFHITHKPDGLLRFIRVTVQELAAAGRISTAEKYRSSLSSISRFTEGADICLAAIDATFVSAYENHLLQRGLCPNTTSYYMRIFRAIYNRAVEKELISQGAPFRRVYTGIDKTRKRAIMASSIRRLRDLKLQSGTSHALARDLFMFSFYTRGMSFIDMAFVRKTDLRNGVLTYRRHKTRQLITVKWEKPMQEIVDRYNRPESPYLLPIIQQPGTNERRQYRNAAHLVNTRLHDIGREINLPITLTTYVARHSWASIALSKNIAISTISDAMGHDSEATTKIYLTSLSTAPVDRANRIVMQLQ